MKRPCIFHFVCLSCRRSKKLRNPPTPQKCAECGALLHSIGKRFAAPRRADDAQWLKIELMIANGWNGYNWPVAPQMSLREVKDTLRAYDESNRDSYRKAKIEWGIERCQQLARVRHRKAKTTLKKQRLEEEQQRLYQDQILEQATRINQDNVDTRTAN